jgi:DNA-binding transcriptional ArsR family regulator
MALAFHALLLIFAAMKLQGMEAAAERVSEFMKLLANKHRLLVLCQLAEGEKSVGELARLLDVREPAMSQQLSVLRREGLVRPRREAQTIYYALARDDVRRLMEFLYATYCGDAAAQGVAHQDGVRELA